MAPLGNLFSRIFPEKFSFNPRNISLHQSAFSEYLRGNDLKGAIQFYEDLSASEQSLLVEGISSTVEVDDFFDDWYDGGDGPALAALLRGALLVKRVWVYRGGGRGSDVSEESWRAMEAALDQAIESLKPILYDPIYGREANARCIRAAKGLGLDWDQLDILKENIRRDGHHNLFGEIDYLVTSCAKWLGSHEKMFEHAFNTVAEFPGAPTMGCLIAAAHFERQIYMDLFDNDQEQAAAYKTDQKVLSELRSASQRLIRSAEAGAQSAIFAHNIFAITFYYFDRDKEARPHFEYIKDQITPYPSFHFTAEELQKAHTLAMRS